MVVYSSGNRTQCSKVQHGNEYLAVLLNESLFIKRLPKKIQKSSKKKNLKVISAKLGLKLVNMQQFTVHYLDEL